ncbi:GNAT family N-acetyltransferase [Poseidonibacter lekithochrous]|uniref:GNAT family N-acetyltransferase n=1 Tax=Poseidonibacter lekithochrous TaxID=1904463 RepID=UPI0008FC6E29|nr:GNAT family N-acetyltransferase [Poseidonibacter lekithochrous]QKJ22777.1 acetyltransferase (GNAT family) [Poseidonibacter lekithochrous]
MTSKQLEKNNINNVRNLFALMGSKSWPKRLWANYDYEKNDINVLMNKVLNEDNSHLIPLWDKKDNNTISSTKLLKENGFDISYTQTAMALDVHLSNNVLDDDLNINFVGSKEDIATWVEIASNSFSFPIIYETIYNLSKNKNIDLLLIYKDDIPIGTALIFTNSNVVGVHFLSILSSYRGNSFSKNIIEEIVSFAKREELQYLTLITSSLSSNFYEKLGFKKQFVLNYYIKQCNKS